MSDDPKETPLSANLDPVSVDITNEPEAITELFRSDPMELLGDEARINRIIHYYRKTRMQLAELESKPKKAATPKVAKEDLAGASAEDVLKKLGI